MERTWIDFWKISAEHANEAVMTGKILRSGILSIDEEGSEKSISDMIFEPTHRYYLKNLKVMDELIKQKQMQKKTLYRNVFNEIYHSFEPGDLFEQMSFTSCFKDKYYPEYGDFCVEVRVKKGTNYLEYDNTVILPPGIYKLVECNDLGYVIELHEQHSLFSSEE
jgi:hypothetical protein